MAPPKKKPVPKRIALQRDALIVQKRTEGKSLRVIASEVSSELKSPIHHQTVANVLRREDIQPILENNFMKVLGVSGVVIDRIIDKAAKLDKKGNDKVDQQICWDANKVLAQTTGSLIAPNQTNIYQNFVIQQNNLVPPVIDQLIDKYRDDIIDVE